MSVRHPFCSGGVFVSQGTVLFELWIGVPGVPGEHVCLLDSRPNKG
jgi:hypothetical protein